MLHVMWCSFEYILWIFAINGKQKGVVLGGVRGKSAIYAWLTCEPYLHMGLVRHLTAEAYSLLILLVKVLPDHQLLF